MDLQQPMRRSARATRGQNPSGQSFRVLVEELLAKGQNGEDSDEDFQAKNVEPDEFDIGFDGSSDDAADEADDTRPDVEEGDDESTTRQKSKVRARRAEDIARARHRAPPVVSGMAEVIAGPSTLAPAPAPAPVPRKSRGERSRQSQRQLTVQNSIATATKASKPKKPRLQRRTQTQTLTQADLILRALDNEEGNLSQHRNYLKNEEARRKKAKTVVKPKVVGEALRWISRVERDEGYIPPPNVVAQSQPASRRIPRQYLNTNPSYTIITLSDEEETLPIGPHSPMLVEETPSISLESPSYSAQQPHLEPSHTDALSDPPLPKSRLAQVAGDNSYDWIQKRNPQVHGQGENRAQPSKFPIGRVPSSMQTAEVDEILPAALPLPPPARPTSPFSFDRFLPTSSARTSAPEPVEQPVASEPLAPAVQLPIVAPLPPYKGVVTRNYLIHTHELSDELAGTYDPPLKKPTWGETMNTLFGDHAEWTKMKVYDGVKMVDKCPITGLPAIYKCPHTGIPYANKEAYQILQQLLRREHTTRWSEELGLFV